MGVGLRLCRCTTESTRMIRHGAFRENAAACGSKLGHLQRWGALWALLCVPPRRGGSLCGARAIGRECTVVPGPIGAPGLSCRMAWGSGPSSAPQSYMYGTVRGPLWGPTGEDFAVIRPAWVG